MKSCIFYAREAIATPTLAFASFGFLLLSYVRQGTEGQNGSAYFVSDETLDSRLENDIRKNDSFCLGFVHFLFVSFSRMTNYW